MTFKNVGLYDFFGGEEIIKLLKYYKISLIQILNGGVIMNELFCIYFYILYIKYISKNICIFFIKY